jgi:hypothetical protein
MKDKQYQKGTDKQLFTMQDTGMEVKCIFKAYQSNTTRVTCGTGTVYLSGAPEFTLIFL